MPRQLRWLRAGWIGLGLTLLLLLALEGCLRVGFAIKDRVRPLRPAPLLTASLPPWHAAYDDELSRLLAQGTQWRPYVYFREKPFRGRFIHVGPDGLRHTWAPAAPARQARPLRIWFLGGSGAWGWGARDDHTLPSLLARVLTDRGIAAQVTNLAQIGYVSTQDLLTLMDELRSGGRPDLVIFHHGSNDVFSAYQNGVAGLPQNEINRVREFNLRKRPGRLAVTLLGALLEGSATERLAAAVRNRLLPPAAPSPAAPFDDRLAAEVVEKYRANLEAVDALAQQYHFRYLAFWQPVVFTKPHPAPYEQEILRKYGYLESPFELVDRRLNEQPREGVFRSFRNLSDVYDHTHDLAFTDFCHVTESAQAPIAEAILGAVIDALPPEHQAPAGTSPAADGRGPGTQPRTARSDNTEASDVETAGP